MIFTNCQPQRTQLLSTPIETTEKPQLEDSFLDGKGEVHQV